MLRRTLRSIRAEPLHHGEAVWSLGEARPLPQRSCRLGKTGRESFGVGKGDKEDEENGQESELGSQRRGTCLTGEEGLFWHASTGCRRC